MVTGSGYIPDWYACDCGSSTYANLFDNGKTILCGACGRQQDSSGFILKFIVGDKDRAFEESING